jgi:hypothetical protein
MHSGPWAFLILEGIQDSGKAQAWVAGATAAWRRESAAVSLSATGLTALFLSFSACDVHSTLLTYGQAKIRREQSPQKSKKARIHWLFATGRQNHWNS